MSSEKKRRQPSLKFKLISMVLLITIGLGSCAIAILQYIMNNSEKQQLNTFDAYSRSLSDAIAAQYYERYGEVQEFSLSPALFAKKKDSIVETLNLWTSMHGVYDLIIIVDLEGHLISVNNKSPDSKPISSDLLYRKNFSNSPWFKAVVAGKYTEDKEKGFTGTFVEDVKIDPYITEVYGEKRLSTGFSTIVKDSKGKPVGVITNRASTRWFEGAFLDSYGGLKKQGISLASMTLLGKDGTLLFEYHSDPKLAQLEAPKYNFDNLLKVNLFKMGLKSGAELIARKSGALTEVNPLTGEDEIVGFSPIEGKKFTESLGWSVLIHDSKAEGLATLIRAKRIFLFTYAISILVSILGSYIFSEMLARDLGRVATALADRGNALSNTAQQIGNSSTLLSDASAEQASAIQETAAAIDEVSAMVKKSADNASQSLQTSQKSREAAEQGKVSVQEMIQSIEEIRRSNLNIMDQTTEGNRQISEIVKVIAEIGNKTKVINEIVFQTKLLSFNASVEAARAGEHGKGFAVVAEEVGNLAQMSGNAAKEITAMLESSIQKVEGIISNTRSRVDNLILEGKQKVEFGNITAKKCGDSLGNILDSVSGLDQMVGEISSASQEQAQGVSEINKAINQLDQSTQENATIAQQAAVTAQQLNLQSDQIKRLVQDLSYLVNGKSIALTASENTAKGPSVPTNVVQFKPKKVIVPPLKAQKKEQPVQNQLAGKMGIPDANDPRFEDV